jgi:hypothetical protein
MQRILSEKYNINVNHTHSTTVLYHWYTMRYLYFVSWHTEKVEKHCSTLYDVCVNMLLEHIWATVGWIQPWSISAN